MDRILILDFGSQFTQLIARRLREYEVYCEVWPFNSSKEKIAQFQPKGIILSGGPQSVYDDNAPTAEIAYLSTVAPLLGICYGMQLLVHKLGGVVKPSPTREYGRNKITWLTNNLYSHSDQTVWMSHGDVVVEPPLGYKVLAQSGQSHIAAVGNERNFGVQFHPEVTHTEFGDEVIKSFVFNVCGARADWTTSSMREQLREAVLSQVKSTENVLMALSGGVDSTVVATLLSSILGRDRVQCVFVDTGLLRLDEENQVISAYSKLNLSVIKVDAKEKFLNALRGISDPEKKRKIIGGLFIESFEETIKSLGKKFDFLAQGTLYPDVIESVSVSGVGHTIKSHHNVGGLPEKMNLKLLEPVRWLFKDEVRRLGFELGLHESFIQRHPFPGPGLALRVIGEIDAESLELCKLSDAVFIRELKKHNIYNQIWQAFTVITPIKTVGIMGDGRTYERVCALRAVVSENGMTADWYRFDHDFLAHVSNCITNEVRGINRVVYDITSKPPGTIEWE